MGEGSIVSLTQIAISFAAELWRVYYFTQQKLKREPGTVLSEHMESEERIERLGIPVWGSDISGSSDVVGLEKTS